MKNVALDHLAYFVRLLACRSHLSASVENVGVPLQCPQQPVSAFCTLHTFVLRKFVINFSPVATASSLPVLTGSHDDTISVLGRGTTPSPRSVPENRHSLTLPL